MRLRDLKQPCAIAMWDFSWLERRWPGAGYEDWDLALDGLAERGYDAVRIDAFPHLIASDAGREWILLPHWNQNDWGSPALNRVSVQPGLNDFVRRCRERGIAVGLSTWFRKDETERNKLIPTPERLAEIWKLTLDSIAAGGLLDAILYVDICNEWPCEAWTPFLQIPETERLWTRKASLEWINRTLAALRDHYPGIDYTFSMVAPAGDLTALADCLPALDFLEPHI